MFAQHCSNCILLRTRCEDKNTEAAIRLLNKYLTQDLTHMVNSKTRKDRIGSSKYLKKCIYLYKFALTVAKTSVNTVIVLDTTCTTTSINS